ncbi:MAG: glycosyltransferase family 4 protein [Verrucomicrobiota bacterium]
MLTARLKGYVARINQEWKTYRIIRSRQEKWNNYQRWKNSVIQSNPDVFIGSSHTHGGVRNHILAIQRHSELSLEVVPNESIIKSTRDFLPAMQEDLLGFIPNGQPVVHTHVVPWIIRWAHELQKRGSYWIHTYHLPYVPEHGKSGLEDWQIEINDALINEACHADIRLSVSRWQQADLKSDHGIICEYLPNGVDTQMCDRGDAEQFRRDTGITKPFVLYVGRDTPIKNPREFIQLAERLPHLDFVVIGQGLGPEAFQKWRITPLPNVTMLGSFSQEAVQHAIAACSLLVVTSHREGLPTLVLEAMTRNKPIIVPNERGCLEAINQGEYGKIYDLGDVDDLAEVTEREMANPSSTNAREHILKQYDWRVVSAKLDNLYRSKPKGKN